MTVNDAGTFGGTGISAGTTTVNLGGAVAPGTSAGVLTLDEVRFDTGSTLSIQLAGGGGVPGTDFDLLNVNGEIDLVGDPILSVLSLGNFLPTIGDEFEVMTWQTGLNGTFDLSVDPFFGTNDIGFQAIITNPGGVGDLTLRAVPEPASFVLLGLGGLAVLAQRRHKDLSIHALNISRGSRARAPFVSFASRDAPTHTATRFRSSRTRSRYCR